MEREEGTQVCVGSAQRRAVVGLVVLASGVGVFSGNVLARTVGVLAATVSLIANFFFIPAFPIWSITVVTIDVLIIWALTAHGAEMRRP